MGHEGAIVWYCCKCRQFWSYRLYVACVNCHHRRGPCCRLQGLGKTQRRSVTQAGPPTDPKLQPQDVVQSLTGDFEGHHVRKVSAAEPSIKWATSFLNNKPPKNPRQEFSHSELPLDLLKHQDEGHAIVSQQRQTFYPIPSEPALQKLDQVMVRDTNTDNLVPLSSSPNLSISRPAVTTLRLSAYAADTLQQWLKNIAKAGRSARSSIPSASPSSISGRKAIESDMDGSLRTLLSKSESSTITSEAYAAYEKAPTLEIGKRPREERCRIPSLKDYLKSSALRVHGSTDKIAYQDIAILDEIHKCLPKGPRTLTTLDHVPPPSVDILGFTEEVLFNLLTQVVYSALYFDPSGSFRKCGSDPAVLRPATSSNGGQTLTTPRKRRLEGDCESNNGDNEKQQSGKTKRSRVQNEQLGRTQRRFACLHCKRDFSYGDDARLMCAGWSNPSIDTVLRRHLRGHVQAGHLTQNKYNQVKLLMREYSHRDARQAEELWIAAYMEVFNIGPQDRHLVPSPYYDSAELASNPSFSAFGRRLMDRIRENPATAIPLMNYITEDEALSHARNADTERLRDTFRAREAQLIEENNAERAAAIRELDDHYDEMQRRLYRVLESALDPSQQLEGGSQTPPQQGVGTISRNTDNPSYLSRSTSTNEGRIFASHLLSDQPSGFLTPTTAALPVSPEFNSHSGRFRGSTVNDSLYNNVFFVGPRSMNEHDVENEAFFDIAARQRLASTPAASTHHVNIDTDFLHTRANDTSEGSEAALPRANVASDVPSAQFGSSPHSGYGNSYARCGGCEKICHPEQELCESCADFIGNPPLPPSV